MSEANLISFGLAANPDFWIWLPALPLKIRATCSCAYLRRFTVDSN